MSAQSATGAQPNPFATLAQADPSLHIPATEDAFARLSATQQSELATALAHVDCGNIPVLSATMARVVCDTDGSIVYLIGEPIFTGDDVASAEPVTPSAGGSPAWAVRIELTTSGADSWRRWTSKYHVANGDTSHGPVQTRSSPACGLSAPIPCSDFVAFVIGDEALSVPITLAVLDSVTQISGNFDKAYATALAHQLSS
jgi:hypothetical protein